MCSNLISTVMDSEFLSLEEVAIRLNKSTQTIRRMIKRGELSAERVKTPQGFQYHVHKENIFYNSPIQTEELPRVEAKEKVLTNQTQILTSQNAVDLLSQNDFYRLDRNQELLDFFRQQHEEKMLLIHILEGLQAELVKARIKPKSFRKRCMEWLF